MFNVSETAAAAAQVTVGLIIVGMVAGLITFGLYIVLWFIGCVE